jgi:hypothetical protein
MSTRIAGKFRRSTRVPLRIVISVQGLSDPVSCDAETVTVNRHGAMIVSGIPLHSEVKIEVESAKASVPTPRSFMLILIGLGFVESR